MRPTYHYAPAANWLSDPNGLVHHAGEWHLFYQYNPEGEDWGHMSWGHAVSRDLRNWEELPVAIRDDAQHMIFSGSAVVDHQGTAGFGSNAMVAVYTGAMSGEPARQTQCLASSTDDGRTWTKFAGNPVLDLGLADFRDPNLFWHASTQRWIMVVALPAEKRALVYASTDLRAWRELSEIRGVNAPGEVWECPLLVELPVEGGPSRWLFKVDALRNAPGSGTIYCVGTFDGEHFRPDSDSWSVADWGTDFYASIAWHEPRDSRSRPLWIGWMGNHAYQGRLPRKVWRGAMSAPRRIWLRRSGQEHVLCQEVALEAVTAVPMVPQGSRDVPIASHMRITGNAWHLRLGDREGRSIEITRYGGCLRASRKDAQNPFLDADREIALPPGPPVDLWLDVGSIELFADGGAVALTMQHCMTAQRIDHRLEMAGPT